LRSGHKIGGANAKDLEKSAIESAQGPGYSLSFRAINGLGNFWGKIKEFVRNGQSTEIAWQQPKVRAAGCEANRRC
jgi:hypothetical protein